MFYLTSHFTFWQTTERNFMKNAIYTLFPVLGGDFGLSYTSQEPVAATPLDPPRKNTARSYQTTCTSRGRGTSLLRKQLLWIGLGLVDVLRDHHGRWRGCALERYR